mgnify:CR=1 FL=1
MNMKNFASYGIFETESRAPIATLDSREAGSAAKAKKTVLHQARLYERETGLTVYVTETKMPKSFTVPVMETRVVYGKKKLTETPTQRRKKLGLQSLVKGISR